MQQRVSTPGIMSASWIDLQETYTSAPPAGILRVYKSGAGTGPSWVSSAGHRRTIDDGGGSYAKIWTMPLDPGVIVGRNTADTLTRKTITDASNLVRATSLATVGTDVSLSAAAAPSAGYVLTATSGTAATWAAAAAPPSSGYVMRIFGPSPTLETTTWIGYPQYNADENGDSVPTFYYAGTATLAMSTKMVAYFQTYGASTATAYVRLYDFTSANVIATCSLGIVGTPISAAVTTSTFTDVPNSESVLGIQCTGVGGAVYLRGVELS